MYAIGFSRANEVVWCLLRRRCEILVKKMLP